MNPLRMIRTATVAFIVTALLPAFAAQGVPPPAGDQPWDEARFGPLPRWREGGTPQPPPDQSLTPFAVSGSFPEMAPTSGVIASPPEFAPMKGVLFRYSTSAWSAVVTNCVAALTGNAQTNDIAYVIVSSTSQQASATSQFTAAGANLGKVQFIIMPTDSIWIRDYGPHFIWQGSPRAIADSHYYPTRPLDNFIPTLLGDDYFVMPTYDMGVYYSGGNFQCDSARNGYMTALVNLDNPGFSAAFLAELFSTYQGIDTLHVFPQMPWTVDGTGHIDMWMYVIDDDTVIISEFIPGSNATAIQITTNAVTYMQNLGFQVFRTPALNGNHPQGSGTHFTYTNAFRVNNRIFVPTYGAGDPAHLARDTQALAAWQGAAPDCQIIPINCYDIIWAAGAIHCIIMQVPLYAPATPGAHVVSPDGHELLVGGSLQDIHWAAIDDQSVTAVDLHASYDNGATFSEPLATGLANTGHFNWTLPGVFAAQARIRVTAHDAQSNVVEAISEQPFEITVAPRTVYDFSSGAGVNKWGWGYQTSSWSVLNSLRRPAALGQQISALQAGAYDKIATSNATGGDTDANRYISPIPSSGNESSHIFEFTIGESTADILDIGVLWEGYGDDCTQMELYVWDYTANNWGDGAGLTGENRFMDNFAGNRDARMNGHIRSDFARYVGPDGLFTLLLYAERSGDRSFHDYLAVTVAYFVPGDFNGNAIVDYLDMASFVAVLLEEETNPSLVVRADVDRDGLANGEDVAAFVNALLGP